MICGHGSCRREPHAEQGCPRGEPNQQGQPGAGEEEEAVREPIIYHGFNRTNIGGKVKLHPTSERMTLPMELRITDASQQNSIPTLNASEIPHAVRHGAIHGALGTLNVGQAMILIAPHNPIPLLKEVEEREENFELSYLKEEENDYHIKFTRIS